jgi:hypothetical protein
MWHLPTIKDQSAKYEFASSKTTRTTFAFDACFVWKLAPLADERCSFFMENRSVGQVRVCNVKYVLDHVNRRDRYSMKNAISSSARRTSLV